ncbi:MAG: bifunctional DNA-formamidopyrimidine glycosylase/DNA-(apurinic or apyrimidinic site) lyase [Polyangia bacterium]
MPGITTMPELPEVEYARRQLQRWLGGATITSAVVHDARILGRGAARGRSGTARTVERALVGRRILKVERRGKWLRMPMDEGIAFSHLGMTGKWTLAKDDTPLRFERLRIDVDKGRMHHRVRYLDPRLFGIFTVCEKDLPVWDALGPDPLHDGIDVDRLVEKLCKKQLAIKPALLDQKLLAGVGNIQATEALFLARIDPRRPSRSLSRIELAAVARGIDESIRRTLEHESGPQITYVEERGADNPFLVYGRDGEPCPRCKTKLVKVTQAGRTTVYCPHCQAGERRGSRSNR